MKRGQLLSVLLLVSVGCVAGTKVDAQQKSATTGSLTKNKTLKKSQTASSARRMTEKDITECTTLINKVAQTDKILQQELIAKSTNNSKIAEQLKKPADLQLFASDNPAAIAHLTGKSVSPANQPIIKQPTSVAKTIPTPTVATVKPIVPTSKTVAKSTALPPNTQIFASSDPKAIAHLTGKTTTPLTTWTPKPSSSMVKPTKTHKPVAAKPMPTPASHPHIELFTPNSPDLNHLKGQSASLEKVEQSSKSATPKKSTSKAKKSPSSTTVNSAAVKSKP